MSFGKLKLLAGITLVAVFLISAAPASALHKGLYQVRGTTDFYFVDANGVTHVVQNPDIVRPKFFAQEPVQEIALEEIRDLPTGEVITEMIGPDQVIEKKTTVIEKKTTTTNETTTP